MKDIVIASNNLNKIREIKAIMKSGRFRIISLSEAGYKKDIKETGETLKENARIKAVEVRKKIKDKIIISDDSGLEVDYLAKAPGVYSARFAGPGCTYSDNNKKLLKLLKGVPREKRKAAFRTVAYIIFPDGSETFADGRVEGFITEKNTGINGFGYDPVFRPTNHKKTYAQMDDALKNSISHRKKAFKKAARIVGKRYGF